jgi:hypothetical protein
MQRLATILAAMSLMALGTYPSSGQVQRVLLSVDGLGIPAGGALAAFHIDTWGVVPLAVCRLPPQWEMKQEKFMDSEGFLSGRSDPYHRTLSRLDKLFLVDVYMYQPLPKGVPKGEYHPASFAGWYTVFDGTGEIQKARRVFKPANFHLNAASRCPDAPPAEP